jgi:hypothetical protein
MITARAVAGLRKCRTGVSQQELAVFAANNAKSKAVSMRGIVLSWEKGESIAWGFK